MTAVTRRHFAVALLLEFGDLACKPRSSPALELPAGGDGKAALARLDRDHPQARVLVVLGSSTAAGVGVTSPETAWVPRYRAHLGQHFPHFVLVNLAVGGYTTFHVQPSSYVPPPGRPKPVAGHNIDAALELRPHAVIVNLPSNDQAAGYTWQEQHENYERLAAAAESAGVPLWLTTAQPRNFARQAQRRELSAARDTLRRKFGARVLDFWAPLAHVDGSLKPELDAGDGTHLNADGHALLARTVIDARIPEALLAARR